MDLNLIRTFVAVYEAKSLTVAAERLYVTQPAVSHGLNRLRREFDDPLFVREGRQMEPTEVARTVYPDLRESLRNVDRVVDRIHGFDPAGSTRHFRLALSELGETGYFPAVAAAVRDRAPGVTLEAVPLDVAQAGDWLTSGAVDLVIASTPIHGQFDHAVLKTTRYVVLGSSDGPLGASRFTFEDFRTADHVLVTGDSGFPSVDAALRRAGIAIEPKVVVSRFAALPKLLVDSSLVAIVPDSMADSWSAARPLAYAELPVHVERVDVCLYKRASSHNRAALDWLFATTQAAVRDVPDFSPFD